VDEGTEFERFKELTQCKDYASMVIQFTTLLSAYKNDFAAKMRRNMTEDEVKELVNKVADKFKLSQLSISEVVAFNPPIVAWSILSRLAQELGEPGESLHYQVDRLKELNDHMMNADMVLSQLHHQWEYYALERIKSRYFLYSIGCHILSGLTVIAMKFHYDPALLTFAILVSIAGTLINIDLHNSFSNVKRRIKDIFSQVKFES